MKVERSTLPPEHIKQNSTILGYIKFKSGHISLRISALSHAIFQGLKAAGIRMTRSLVDTVIYVVKKIDDMIVGRDQKAPEKIRMALGELPELAIWVDPVLDKTNLEFQSDEGPEETSAFSRELQQAREKLDTGRDNSYLTPPPKNRQLDSDSNLTEEERFARAMQQRRSVIADDTPSPSPPARTETIRGELIQTTIEQDRTQVKRGRYIHTENVTTTVENALLNQVLRVSERLPPNLTGDGSTLFPSEVNLA